MKGIILPQNYTLRVRDFLMNVFVVVAGPREKKYIFHRTKDYAR